MATTTTTRYRLRNVGHRHDPRGAARARRPGTFDPVSSMARVTGAIVEVGTRGVRNI
jgi:hypothetical protein